MTRKINYLLKRYDLDDIPVASLAFFGGCLVLALIGFFSWRGDQNLLANGREIRADIIDREIKTSQDCDDDGCTTEYSYLLTYEYIVDDETYSDEKSVDSDIYDRAESSILIRYLPERPSSSNVAETVKNVLPFPLFSIVVLFVGLIGAGVIYWISS